MKILSTPKPRDLLFSDVNMNVVSSSPDELVYNEDAINKSLLMIFSTHVNTRPFRRPFGNRGLTALFEPITPTTANLLRESYEIAIKTWEPRISNFVLECIPDFEIQGYYVECTYNVPALNNKSVNFKFNILKEGAVRI